MKFTAEIKGLAELEKKLRALPTAAAGKALRSAAMSAMTPIQKAAKANVRVRSGALKDAIRKSSRVGPKGEFAAEAGIRMKTGKKQAGWRWHFEEFGTVNHSAHPFLRPAFDSESAKALQIFQERLAKNILKQAKSLTPLPAPPTEPDD